MILEKSPFLSISIINEQKYLYDFTCDKTFEYTVKLKQIINKCQKAQNYSDLVEYYGFELVDFCIKNKLIVSSESKWNISNIQVIEIETSTHCNWKCKYCPVSIDSKKPKTMDIITFSEIIKKAQNLNTIKYVTFNSYNEPTIDKLFMERLEILSKTNLKLRLHTNASGLDKKKMDYFKATGVLEFICFNLPSLNEERFKVMTNSKNFNTVIANIDYAIKIGLPVIFSIQGTKDEINENIDEIKNKYQKLINSEIKPWKTVDRGGTLQNEYKQNIKIKDDFLAGCYTALNWIFINVNGDLFLCCEDYYQKNIYGSIFKGEIFDIVNSCDAIKIRKILCGEIKAPEDFICRQCINMLHNKFLSRYL